MISFEIFMKLPMAMIEESLKTSMSRAKNPSTLKKKSLLRNLFKIRRQQKVDE